MGVSSHPLFPLSMSVKNLLQGSEEDRNSSYGYLWSKVWAGQRMKQKVWKRTGTTTRRVSMKRRARLIEGSRRRAMGIKTRVRTLKRLIPNSESTVGLDELFRDTAQYILLLQMRVRTMQIMVNVLTGSDE